MKAYAHKTTGGPEVIEETDFPIPKPEGHDILVKVLAVATNPVDCKVRDGRRKGGDGGPKIVGFDAAGIVEEVGEKVVQFKASDEVYFAGSIIRQGANAEFTLVDERIVALKPKSLNWEQAASVPLCAITAWEGLIERAGLIVPDGTTHPHEHRSILIIGGSGGAGSMVTQISKHYLKFGTVIATASRPETINWCKKQGADHVIGHKNLKESLKAIGLDAVHVVYCTVDLNTVFDEVIDVVRPCGTIIGITGFSGIDMGKAFGKSVTVATEFMFARTSFNEEPERQGMLLKTVTELIEKGVLVHTQNHHFDWKDLCEAYRFQESGKAIGKITLSVKFQ